MKLLILFTYSILVSLMLVFLFKKIGRNYHFFDIAPEDDPLKIHTHSISYLGGSAMLVTTITMMLVVGFLGETFQLVKIAAIILALGVVFFLGFWDDLRWKNLAEPKPYRKLIGLIIFPLVAAAILAKVQIQAVFFQIPLADYFLTSLLIFVLVNSINYEDGIDGLAGGMSFISLVGFFTLSVADQQLLPGVFSIILAGAIAGFLAFNFPPAKMFMGDSGAFFLGAALAMLSLFFIKPYDIVSAAGIMCILGFPVFEGVLTNLRRVANKKSIFLGDRRHFYDVLYLKKGFSIHKTLLICYAIQAVLVTVGVIIYLSAT